MGIQIITTEAGEELVVLPRRNYDAMLAQLGDEEAEDRMTLRLAAEARAESPLPEAVSSEILRGSTRLKAVRIWRGLSLASLAREVGIDEARMAAIESGQSSADSEMLEHLSRILRVPHDWLV